MSQTLRRYRNRLEFHFLRLAPLREVFEQGASLASDAPEILDDARECVAACRELERRCEALLDSLRARSP